MGGCDEVGGWKELGGLGEKKACGLGLQVSTLSNRMGERQEQ